MAYLTGDERYGRNDNYDGRKNVNINGKRVADPYAWGGYSGTAEGYDEYGNPIINRDRGGAGEDVTRYRSLGEAAAAQQAFQNDYGQANAQASAAQQARGVQDSAIARMQATAANGSDGTRALGQQMTQAGLASQNAAAMSTRGGTMAQIAALRQSMPGQIAYQQQSGEQLRATSADEMAAARQELAAALAGQRQQDAQAAQLQQQQAIAQQQNELQQRQLSQQGQMAYERMAQDTNQASISAQQEHQALNQQIHNQSATNRENSADRFIKYAGAAANFGGGLLGFALSDVRTKRKVMSMADVAALRGGR